MPAAMDLPEDLRELPSKNGLAIRPQPDRDRDLKALEKYIRELIALADEARQEERRLNEHERRISKEIVLHASVEPARTQQQWIAARLKDVDWSVLLRAIHAGELVPVLGPEL